jgi:hypothetical protein
VSIEIECWCFFCVNGKEHPTTHRRWTRVSDRLLVAESLDSNDRVAMKACETCGHKKEDDRVDG